MDQSAYEITTIQRFQMSSLGVTHTALSILAKLNHDFWSADVVAPVRIANKAFKLNKIHD